MEITPIQIAWLAGILEGEGSFSCQCPNKRTRPHARLLRVQIQMTDRDIIERACELMEATSIYERPRPAPRQTVFILMITGHKAERIMRLILPHMGIRRRNKILECLEEWKNRPVMLRERGKRAECHPDRRHKGHGLCEECHRHLRYIRGDLPKRQAVRAARSHDFIFV